MALEQRVDRLEAALARLTEVQASAHGALAALTERAGRLEDRMGQVEAALARLAEAQARTERRVEELAQAQARTERRVEELAQAQARTEQALTLLSRQVGRLGEVIGFTLEDLAREVTPAYLAQRYGISVGELERRFFLVDSEEVEVDLYGDGTRDGQPVVVVGEVRSRIHGRDVDAAVRTAQRLAPQLPGAPVVVLFGFVIHPSARDAASRTGAIVISSSGR